MAEYHKKAGKSRMTSMTLEERRAVSSKGGRKFWETVCRTEKEMLERLLSGKYGSDPIFRRSLLAMLEEEGRNGK